MLTESKNNVCNQNDPHETATDITCNGSDDGSIDISVWGYR